MEKTWQSELAYAAVSAAYKNPPDKCDFDVKNSDFKDCIPNKSRAVFLATNSDEPGAVEVMVTFGNPEKIAEIIETINAHPEIKRILAESKRIKAERKEYIKELVKNLPDNLKEEIIEQMEKVNK